jgi:hypothetical protein
MYVPSVLANVHSLQCLMFVLELLCSQHLTHSVHMYVLVSHVHATYILHYTLCSPCVCIKRCPNIQSVRSLAESCYVYQ